ncbi:hypothetical protein, variant 1 [Aphanomyces invadans]|uniref:HAUS augmin-like complex subunit 3 N-terminal domain-containing protein n=1 Tax=Aphanomyces invadans TaxID=157072 RepID=A0A024UD04_9STRA|nr:hypothetical protein, variant 1 [Aphanomyces invadans]ETW04090.1 hypothetical protein, variant 1 [Aphanomyces invadans]|eukprot:XP_008867046.1 hypothetical protein, variant 1 [Aphanomyces invadans]
MEDRLCHKLRLMGFPLDITPQMFRGVCESPSLRVHAFLHWFLDVLAVEQSLAVQFSAAEQATLAATTLATGTDLHAKGVAQSIDDDEAQLLADIERLEKQHAKETRKVHVLRRHLETVQDQATRLCPRTVYSTDPTSGLEAIDDILNHLAEGSNALELAALSPTACISLSAQEDKILDSIQAHVMPYFQSSSPPRALSIIAESPMQSHAVTWMMDAIASNEEYLEGREETDGTSWSRTMDQWRDAFFAVEFDWLHANLAALDDVPSFNTSIENEFEADEELEVTQWMQHTLPALVEAVAEAKVSSLVVGDYPAKYTRQEQHLERLNAVLVELERQTARLQLMVLVLSREMDTMKSVQRTIYSVLQDMQRQLQDAVSRVVKSTGPQSNNDGDSASPSPGHPMDTGQVESMRRQVRHEWAALGQEQESFIQQLRDLLESAPTVTAPLQQVCHLKDIVETDVARAIQSIYAKQQTLV